MIQIIRTGFVVLILFTLALFFTTPIFAQVVINEVRPNGTGSSEPDEFIELYNNSSNPEPITGWKLSDMAGSVSVYTIPQKELNPGEFISFRRSETEITLNNDKDSNGNQEGVILQDSSGNEKDRVSFGKYDNEDQSLSRTPDGSGNFVDYTDLSEGLPNIAPPTQSPAATAVAATATAIATTTPANTPTPTPSPTKKPTSKPTPTATPEVLGDLASDSLEILETSTPGVDSNSGKKFPVLAVILVLTGAGLLGFSIFSFVRGMKKGYTNGSENPPTQIS